MPARAAPALLVAAAATLLVAACGRTRPSAEEQQARAAAAAAVVEFHARIDAGRYDEIYDGADPEYQARETRDQHAARLAATYGALGKVKGATVLQSGAGTTPCGIFARILQETTFESGRAIETFRFGVRDGRAVLLGRSTMTGPYVVRDGRVFQFVRDGAAAAPAAR
jgi:hypothetical protein